MNLVTRACGYCHGFPDTWALVNKPCKAVGTTDIVNSEQISRGNLEFALMDLS